MREQDRSNDGVLVGFSALPRLGYQVLINAVGTAAVAVAAAVAHVRIWR